MSIRSKIVLTVTLFALVLLAAFLLDNRIITAMGRHRLVSLNNAMLFVTDTGIALITIVLLAFMLFTRRFQWFVLSSFAALTSLEITYVLKKIFQIPRPFLVENLAITPLTEPNGYSFPSLHATFCLAMVVFMDKIFKNKIWKWLAIIFYVVVIGSRLYLGVHYVSDLLAGGMIGYGVSKTLLFLDEKYSIWLWLCREWKKNVEVRRQVAHCCTGMALVLLIKFGLLQPWMMVLMIVVGFCLSFLVKRYRLEPFRTILHYFERPMDKQSFPGKGPLCMLIGAFLAVSLFEPRVALGALAIMAVGDALTTFVGVYWGKRKNPFNPSKHIESTLIALPFSIMAAFNFVDFPKAFVGATVALIFEALAVRFIDSTLDDNIVIPVVAGIVMGWM